ncbi:hypothetical protein BZM27_10500 [Paraburkholderia steynii]|uniref:ABC-three component systems C-terminal domain-containing protein n=1 Tax=Paraburkholderia steynii TaxID=1245441 RepID=A0A4V6N9H7_9BURK|nr:hypothetical protein BZM27_10500 [Paraburkholderia steynii]
MSKRDQKPQIEKPINTSATSTIVAFTFQFERTLFKLFSSETLDKRVGMETLDDVAELTTNADGTITAKLEQDAHTVQSFGHPFQDSSRKLWHTLRVWLSHLDRLKAYSDTEFCLVTNSNVPKKTLVRLLSEATSDHAVKEAVALLRQQADEVCKTEESAAKVEAEFVKKYDDADLSYLIKRLNLLDEGGTKSGEPPREATIQRFVLPSELVEQGEEIYQRLLGFAVDRCQKAWKKKEAVWFSPQKFRDLFHEEVARRSLRKYLDRPMVSTGFQAYVESGGRDHFFLKQLTRLGLSRRLIDNQLDKYWTFYIERVRLEDDGVSPVDWSTREDLLHQRWQDCLDNAELELENPTPEALGKLTLNKTLDENYKAPLGIYGTQYSYFTHGHYHHLANEPTGKHFVYWHPDFGNKPPTSDEGES